MTEIINKFRNEYLFLSNFYPHKMIILSCHNPNLIPYKSIEHYYQANKATNLTDHMKIVNLSSAGAAKRFGIKIKCREDWDKVKIDVMKKGLIAKFSDENLKKKLLNTGSKILIEGNTWGDTYWGVDINTGYGYNMLGKLLMEIRNEVNNG